MRASVTPDLKLGKLNRLLREIWGHNPFYRRKWEAHGVSSSPLLSLAHLSEYPFTTREELFADQLAAPPLGTNLTFALEKYKHVFASSGTTRQRMYWADTSESWAWVTACSRDLFSLSGVLPSDRMLLALNFSAASGPWIMQEGARQLGCLCASVSGQETSWQLEYLQRFKPTVLVAGPATLAALSQALPPHLRPSLAVSKIISFGKEGWDFETIRSQAAEVWRSEACNRYGMTEAGSIAAECPQHHGLHLLEEEFLAECVCPRTLEPVGDGEPGELVLTNLGRFARPIIRYLTGDKVRLRRDATCPCGRTGAIITGGITRWEKK